MAATVFVEMQSLEDNFFYRVHIEQTRMQRKFHSHIWLLTRILKNFQENGHLRINIKYYYIIWKFKLNILLLPVFHCLWYWLSSSSKFLNWEYLLCTLLSVFLLPVFSKHVRSLLPHNDLPPEKGQDLENSNLAHPISNNHGNEFLIRLHG